MISMVSKSHHKKKKKIQLSIATDQWEIVTTIAVAASTAVAELSGLLVEYRYLGRSKVEMQKTLELNELT